MSRPIFVTQPELPPLADFIPYLERIWDSRQLTNGGPFHQQLEAALGEYLGVEHICLFSNGTLALMTALQALGVEGEVITTPYSFVATAHAILWNGLKPVFVDIDAESFNLDPARIEAAITPDTTAILPVHCYGRPCDVDEIRKIADRHGLRVVYDAAHAFGVRDAGGSVLRHGDLSVLSFHATKVFSTFEGGAIVCPDASTKQRIDYLKNFGFSDETTVLATGINGKLNEIQAAFGLLSLKSIDANLARRQWVDQLYRSRLAGVPGLRLPATFYGTANYSYFPILVGPEYPMSRDALYAHLRDNQIYGRRYFYPLITDFPMYRSLSTAGTDGLPSARRVSGQVICLPLYPSLSEPDVTRIADLIVSAGRAAARVAA